MDTLAFLQRVLPAEGFCVITVINDGAAPQQGFFPSIEKLATACITADSRNNNTYYAISTFRTRQSRKQDNVHLTKVIVVDVDCAPDKPYLNQKEGLAALAKFITATGLPRPLIISSGRGLHVYWVMNEALTPERWLPLAHKLKAATVACGFKVDPVPTANSALVLRPTGTRNPKNNAVVRVLMDAPDHDPLVLENILSKYVTNSAPASQTNHSPVPPAQPKQMQRGHSALLDALAVKQEFPKSVAHVVASKCKQIAWAINNPDQVDEPLWYALIGVAATCTDPEETAKTWSQGHPKYDETDTLKKLAQWQARTTGPTTCARFKDLRDKGCDGCPVRGKITTPAHLGVEYKSVNVADNAPDDIAKEIPLPKNFKRTSAGIVQTIDGTDVPVCHFDIYPTGYGYDESKGYETVRFKWDRKHVGWTDLVMRQAYLTDEHREFPTALADQGIVLSGKDQTRMFQFMLRSYMDKLREARTVTNFYNSMGWKEDFTRFVIGDRMYKRAPDGTVGCEDISMSMQANRLSSTLYTRKGTASAWTTATELLGKAQLFPHMFSVMQAFASPLWALTGLKGITISLAGPTGSGKSVAQLWQQSVWGDPTALHFTAKFTQNTLFSRLGLYSNLPMTIDEATLMPAEDVGDFCHWVTQGRDKARLNRNADERDPKTWATVVTVSTNVSFASKMASTGMDSDAQMARLLELSVPVQPIFSRSSDAGRRIVNFLQTNHGMVGDIYARALLALGKDELLRRIDDANETFGHRYNVKFSGSERFWQQALVLTDVAGTLAEDLELLGFDYRTCIRWVLDNLTSLRRQISDAHATIFSLVDTYLMESRDKVITVMHTGTAHVVDHNHVPRAEIVARLDLYRDSNIDKWRHGTIMLSKPRFRMWLSARGHDYGAFVKDMVAEGVDATPTSGRISFARETGLKGVGQTTVVGLNTNHPELQHYMERFQDNADEVFAHSRPELVVSNA